MLRKTPSVTGCLDGAVLGVLPPPPPRPQAAATVPSNPALAAPASLRYSARRVRPARSACCPRSPLIGTSASLETACPGGIVAERARPTCAPVLAAKRRRQTAG